MRARVASLLRDESGQSLIFFVFTMTLLMAVLALAINVGNWVQEDRKAQATADAAALAAGQETDVFQADPIAHDYVDQNWPGATATFFQGTNGAGQHIATINVQKNVNAIFTGALQALGVPASVLSLDIKVTAASVSEAPRILNEVSPLGLFCDDPCKATLNTGQYPWAMDGTEVFFQYTAGSLEQPDSTLGPIGLPGVDPDNFSTYMTCDPSVTANPNCNQENAEASFDDAATCGTPGDDQPCWYRRVLVDPPTLHSAIGNSGSYPHLVAIYDKAVQGDAVTPTYYHVIGWAYFQVTSIVGSDDNFVIGGTFHKLFFDSSKVSSDGSGRSKYDFGVRAVALSR